MAIGGIDTIRQENGHVMVNLPVNWQNWLKPPKDARYIQLQAAALDMDLEQYTCLGTTSAAICVRLGAKQHSLLLPATPVRATATIVLLQIRFLRTNTGIQTASTVSSEQAFVTAVLEPVLPLEEKPKHPQLPAKASAVTGQSAEDCEEGPLCGGDVEGAERNNGTFMERGNGRTGHSKGSDKYAPRKSFTCSVSSV